MLHKQRWSSTRQNIPFETFEVTIHATLDTRRKNGVQFSSKNRSSWISRLQITPCDAKQGDFVTVEIETDKESKKIDPYCCAIKAMVDIPPRLKTVGHVLRQILRHIFFLFERRERKSRWLRIFYAISTVSNSCRRVRNPTKTNI